MSKVSQSPNPLIETAVESLSALHDRRDEFTGSFSPYHRLQVATGGLPWGAVSMIVGAPGSGKTLMGLYMAQAAARYGIPSKFVSLHEDPDRLAQRLMLMKGDTNLMEEKIPSRTWDRLNQEAKGIANSPLRIVRVAALTELPPTPSREEVCFVDGLFSRGKQNLNRQQAAMLVDYATRTGNAVIALVAGPGCRNRIPPAMLPMFLCAELALTLRREPQEIYVQSIVNRRGSAFQFRVDPRTGFEIAEEEDANWTS